MSVRSLLALSVGLLSPLAASAFPLPVGPVAPPVDLADWTPRAATGKAEPWEKATDKDWTDPRFRLMDTGPFLNGTMEYPLGKGKEKVYKATAVKLGDKGGVLYDRCTMRLMAGWTGGFLQHGDRRFGLLNTPKPAGDLIFASPPGPGWADPDGNWETPSPSFTAPLPTSWITFRGLGKRDRVALNYTVGRTNVTESVDKIEDQTFEGTRIRIGLNIEPSTSVLKRHLFTLPAKYDLSLPDPLVMGISDREGLSHLAFAAAGDTDGVELRVDSGLVYARIAPSPSVRKLTFVIQQSRDAKALAGLAAARSQWQPLKAVTAESRAASRAPLLTKLVRGRENGPFAIDTLTLPHKNPYHALFFCTGLDFLPDGRIAMCTCHGDVWLAKVDEAAGTVSWQRFATGLYHPLGLKVVEGNVVVLERGQLTRLQDNNHDGEADVYQCVSNRWHTGSGEHSYDTCLETDPEGHFYFFKTGDTHLPHGGCLLKVSRDGRTTEVFSTGFRHPIGMGMSPTGVLTGADQEGNWMPATRIDQYTKGGFYGDMRAHHREVPPTTFDPPLCWLPREVDNSAGGQTWVPKGTWGELAGLPLHFSYGRCKAFLLLRQELPGGGLQGGVADLDLHFLSGVCRGRFGPDGHLYACGLNGWQTSAQADGCLQRVRKTGQPLDVPTKMAVAGNTIRLTFSRPLDVRAAGNPSNWRAACWNYEWAKEYGSKRWKPSDPKSEGQDDVPVRSISFEDEGRTAVLQFTQLRPVMQMQVAYHVEANDHKKLVGSVFFTIHETAGR